MSMVEDLSKNQLDFIWLHKLENETTAWTFIEHVEMKGSRSLADFMDNELGDRRDPLEHQVAEKPRLLRGYMTMKMLNPGRPTCMLFVSIC
jgi:hypothetical protein